MSSKSEVRIIIENMRIGILTLPLHTNYGGILQAYALQTVLERMGHEVVVFDTPNKVPLPPLLKLPFCYGKRLVQKLKGQKIRIFQESYLNTIKPIIEFEVNQFITKSINRRVVKDLNLLNPKDFDAIIVGSDQVWRPKYFWEYKGGIANAFLYFARKWNIVRIAYAASFGTDNWEYSDKQTKECGKLLRIFNSVSVREDTAIYLCKEKFHVDASHVLDPTMLLSANDYINIFNASNTSKSKGNLLIYVLDTTPFIEQLINDIGKMKNLTPFCINNPFTEDEERTLELRKCYSVETWLRGFYDADFIVTDSFHACVFAILFKKQFFVVGNAKRGMSRFNSLLKMFGLENRMINENDDFTKIKDINYKLVYMKYEKLKEFSLDFLHSSLSV